MSALALVPWRRRSAPARDLPFWLSDHRSPDLPTSPGGGGLQASGNDYTYDAWGNLTNKTIKQNPTASCAGELLNRADSATRSGTTTTYVYDADGNRVKKSNGSTGTLYWYMTAGIVGESDASGTMKSEYVFFNGERVARRDNPGSPSATVAYYFSDHLKTASVITDSAGVIKADSDYYPWGGELQFVNADSNHYKFTGKERDSETNLDYFGARYYSNGLGRFITPDWSTVPVPVPYADLGDPQTLNQYSYVRDVPTIRFDTDGHQTAQAVVQNAPQVAPAVVACAISTPCLATAVTVGSIAIAPVYVINHPTDQPMILDALNPPSIEVPPLAPATTQTTVPATTSTSTQTTAPASTPTNVTTGAPASTSQSRVVNTSPTQTSTRPTGVPDNWIVVPSKKGGGTVYVNPNNPHERVRSMPGNPNSPNPAQQQPYVKYQNDGKFYDGNGNEVNGDSPESHIPASDFKYPPGSGD